MRKVTIIVLLVVYFVALCTAGTYSPGTNLALPYEPAASFTRFVKNAKGNEVKHIYRVCNGKNKDKCGYWENTATKKKVASGPTTYDKKKKELQISNIKKTDSGRYIIGDGKKYYNLIIQ